jgi:hypothetical protein
MPFIQYYGGKNQRIVGGKKPPFVKKLPVFWLDLDRTGFYTVRHTPRRMDEIEEVFSA